jgi:hypothetical protein
MNFVYQADGFTEEELDTEYQEIIKSFYKRPQILWYYMKMSLGNPTYLKRLSRFFLGFIGSKVGLNI